MRILISSPAFLPRVGGLETAVAQLAEEVTGRGHEVVVLTTTRSDAADAFPFRVIRRPGVLATLRWMRWCEVFLQANLSLKGAWPLLVLQRSWVVAHHSWYRSGDGRIAWQDRLKRRLLRHARSVAVSEAMARDLGTPATVIPNSYRDRVFALRPAVTRSRDLVFLGRLVSDKGADVLLDALALLARDGVEPKLTVVGDGPDAPMLRERAHRLGLATRVEFVGTRTGEELARELNAHRILVVPSRYHEPFGIVALEGIACGCVVVGSAGGGLPEAIGPCGRTFPNGDAAALARVLSELLHSPGALDAHRAAASAHLQRFAPERFASAWLEVLESAAEGSGRDAS
jgi:glycosyltransferase involved in cell wall biosynthesis